MNSLSQYNDKITILNKIKGVDREDGQDFWVKREYDKAAFITESKSGVNNTTIIIGTKIKVLFTDLSRYLPYCEFYKRGDYGDAFTLSLNDFIILGSVPENIDSKNITKVLSKYEPNVCKIQSIIRVPRRSFTRAKIKVEGV